MLESYIEKLRPLIIELSYYIKNTPPNVRFLSNIWGALHQNEWLVIFYTIFFYFYSLTFSYIFFHDFDVFCCFF